MPPCHHLRAPPVATIYQTYSMPDPDPDLISRIDQLLADEPDELGPDPFPWLDAARWTPTGAQPAGLPGIDDLTRYYLDELAYHLP